MTDPVLQTVPLGFQWATVDPFLFCVHHVDQYPAGNEHMGPAASLAGRDLGMDFAGNDGWRMYHGSIVPGLPAAPAPRLRDGHVRAPGLHRPLRLARRDRALRARRRAVAHRGRGHRALRDVPAARPRRPEPVRAVPDLAEPARRRQDGRARTSRCCGTTTSRVTSSPTTTAARTEVTVIAGRARRPRAARRRRPTRGRRGPRPTSRSGTSCSSRGATWTLPPAAGADTVRTLYVFEGAVRIGDHDLEASTGAVLRADEPVDDHRRARTAPRRWCCRAGRSASRSRSTARS